MYMNSWDISQETANTLLYLNEIVINIASLTVFTSNCANSIISF